MDPLRTELTQLVGSDLTHVYALCNAEVDVDTWHSVVYEWQHGTWRVLTHTTHGLYTHMALLPSGTLMVVHETGYLVACTSSTQRTIRLPDSQGRDVLALNEQEVLVCGQRPYLYTRATGAFHALHRRALGWHGSYVHHDHIYLIEMGKRVAVMNATWNITFLPYQREQRLSALCVSAGGHLYAGGWVEGGTALLQRYDRDQWTPVPVPIEHGYISDLVPDGHDLLVAVNGHVYRYREESQVWVAEDIGDAAGFGLGYIGRRLVAWHTDTGQISVYEHGQWIMPLPAVPIDTLRAE